MFDDYSTSQFVESQRDSIMSDSKVFASKEAPQFLVDLDDGHKHLLQCVISK